jgi:hypothetical protein
LFKTPVEEAQGNPASTVKPATERIKIALAISTTSIPEHVRLLNHFLHIKVFTVWVIDLRTLGQSTKIERSTVEQVRARIAMLRERTKEASNAKAFDFDKRLAEIKSKEQVLRQEKKEQKKAEKEKARLELMKDLTSNADDEMAKMMGFGGFGSTKK